MGTDKELEKMTYSQAIAELETIVKEMQGENCSIDNLSKYTSRSLELLKICKFIATKRPSYKLDLSIIAKEFSDYNIQLLETPELEISSTDIRQRIKKGYSIQYITTEQVQQYIRKEELYL